MIEDLKLTDEQLRVLAHRIEEWLNSAMPVGYGVEVGSVSLYTSEGIYRVFYSYENRQGHDVSTSGFFKFHLLDHVVEDFEEAAC